MSFSRRTLALAWRAVFWIGAIYVYVWVLCDTLGRWGLN